MVHLNRWGKCRWVVILSLFGLMLGQPGFSEQERDSQTERPPTRFGIQVNYVEVDVRVTDQAGHFVADLELDDFEILEEGKRQEISSFALVELEGGGSGPPFREAVESDVATNREVVEGRLYLLVLDDLHTDSKRSPVVREAARAFIEGSVTPSDSVAVVHTSGRIDAMQELTSNRPLLLQSVDKFIGRKLRSASLEVLEKMSQLDSEAKREEWLLRREGRTESSRTRDPLEQERTLRARTALEMLRGLSEALFAVPGRRKTVIYFGEGLESDADDVLRGRGTPSLLDEIFRATGEANRANVSIYAVDPRGLTQVGDELTLLNGVDMDYGDILGVSSIQSALQNELRVSQDGLRALSEETGGFAVLNENDLVGGLERIVEESSRYYLLGYYPVDEVADGTYRKLEVRVKRRGIVVRARKGYIQSSSDRSEEEVSGRPVLEGLSPTLNSTILSPLPLPGIDMRATTTSFRHGRDPDKSVVVLIVEMAIETFHFEEREDELFDEVEFSAIAVDEQGNVHAGVHRVFAMALGSETHELMMDSGYRVGTTLDLPPGRYQLRVGAVESGAGCRGSLFFDLEVPDYGGSGFVMSPLVVSSDSESRIPVFAADEDKRPLYLLPSTRRTFSRSDELRLMDAIYNGASVETTTTVKSVLQEVVYEFTEKLEHEGMEPTRGGILHRQRVPLSGLAPGDYLLEVVSRDLAGHGQSVRRIPIVVREKYLPGERDLRRKSCPRVVGLALTTRRLSVIKKERPTQPGLLYGCRCSRVGGQQTAPSRGLHF